MSDEIALLEYDGRQEAVIMPTHEHLPIQLPQIAVFAFVGEVVDDYARENRLSVIAVFESVTKKFPIYEITCSGKQLCLCQAPCGAAAAVQLMDWLIGYGVKQVIATGSCGVLRDIPENAFLVAEKAMRDEGTSFHYLPPARWIPLQPNMTAHIFDFFAAHDLPCEKVAAWTTDAFYRETKQKVAARLAEGCSVVDMECSALAACAQFRGTGFGQFFFTADSLSNVDDYKERGFGEQSLLPALRLAIEIAAALEQ